MVRLVGSIFCALMVLGGIFSIVGLVKMGVNPTPQIIAVIILLILSVFLAVKYYRWKQNQGINIKGQSINEPQKATKSKRKIKVGPIIILIVAILLFGGLIYAVISEDDSKASLGDIANTIDISKEQEININEILAQCDIKAIEIKHDELLDNAHQQGETGYRVKTEIVDNIILYITSDGKVHSAKWADYDFYKDGQVLAKLSDYILTLDEKSNIQYNCQEKVKEILKSPKSANFPNITEWVFMKDNGTITVQSYVDAQNSFGADITSQFQFIIDENGTITSLIVDGTEYIQ